MLKRRVSMLIVFSALVVAASAASAFTLPEGFVYITDVIPTALLEIRYYGENNFMGTRVDGYEAPTAILTAEAAAALKVAADILAEQGYQIKVFDAYRPQRAVNHFMRWAQDLDDQKMKEAFYPDVDKSLLFELGYIAEKSGHTRGSTVDLTLVYMATGEEVDMGSGFDLLGEISHHDTDLVGPAQLANRNILRAAMEAAGFIAYPKEWWHYTLADEPYPDTYFDFEVNMEAKRKENVLDEAMLRAIEQARSTMRQDVGGPFGAAIIDADGNIVCVASNSVLRDHDPTAHGEINAIRLAGKLLGTHDLSGCWLYTTAYPCPMCLAAIMWANIKTVVYGCRAQDTEEIVGFRDAFMYRFIEGGMKDTSVLEISEYGREECLPLFWEYVERQKQMY
jgi:D-alanyl-D-alanine dipeptidase